MPKLDRRQLLYGAAGLVAAASLAGCGDDEPDETPTPDPDSPEGRVDEYLRDNDANLYDGTITDLTGETEITIDVGAGDDGLAYDPAAARIDAGTEVTWEWTGEGGAHNVVSEAEIGSDFEFRSGDLIGDAGHTWAYTLEESGVALYYCEAHRAVGHHGALVVE